MSKFDINEITMDGASIKIIDQLNNMTLKISGHIEFRDPDKILDPFFDDLHSKLLEDKVKKITCDIKSLSFINSSGIKSLINWIMKLNELEDSEKYKIIFLHNKDVSWQTTSLKNLCFLVPDFIEIK